MLCKIMDLCQNNIQKILSKHLLLITICQQISPLILFLNTDNVCMDIHKIYSAKRLQHFRMLHDIIDLGQNDMQNITQKTHPVCQNMSTNKCFKTCLPYNLYAQ